MSIDEEFKSAAKPDKISFDEWLDSLSEEDRASVFSWASNKAISTRKFFDIVTSKNVAVGRDTLDKWRRSRGLQA